jgi:hypothetical protein
MEKNNANTNLFSFRTNLTNQNIFSPQTPAKNEIRTPFGLRSNDRMSSKSGSTQNVLLTEKYNKDIELIRKLQGQGFIRRITKKDSLNLRKNNFLKDKDINTNQVLSLFKIVNRRIQKPFLQRSESLSLIQKTTKFSHK